MKSFKRKSPDLGSSKPPIVRARFRHLHHGRRLMEEWVLGLGRMVYMMEVLTYMFVVQPPKVMVCIVMVTLW